MSREWVPVLLARHGRTEWNPAGPIRIAALEAARRAGAFIRRIENRPTEFYRFRCRAENAVTSYGICIEGSATCAS